MLIAEFKICISRNAVANAQVSVFPFRGIFYPLAGTFLDPLDAMRISFHDLVSTRATVLLRQLAILLLILSFDAHTQPAPDSYNIESICTICRQHSLYHNYWSHCYIANPPIPFRLNAISTCLTFYCFFGLTEGLRTFGLRINSFG